MNDQATWIWVFVALIAWLLAVIEFLFYRPVVR